ncbi:hypothetical protein SAMN05216276_11391, partial [Streptosporangium subroseum]
MQARLDVSPRLCTFHGGVAGDQRFQFPQAGLADGKPAPFNGLQLFGLDDDLRAAKHAGCQGQVARAPQLLTPDVAAFETRHGVDHIRERVDERVDMVIIE